VAQASTLLLSRRDGIRVATIDGEIDVNLSAELGVALKRTVAEESTLIDMRGCTFLDSSAVAALVATIREARAHDHELALIVPRGPARKTLEITGVIDQLPWFEREDEALRALA
jgi:anti-anti-sigma factor